MATTDLTIHQPDLAKPPAPLSVALDRTISHFASKIVAVGLGYEMSAIDAPSADARAAMENRVGVLDTWLQPAGPRVLIEEVAKLMFMPSQSPVEDTKALVKLYASDLADMPLFAVVRACTHFRHGDGHWRPTQGEIRAKAQDYVTDLAREKRKIENVLTARLTYTKSDPERRKEIADLARASIREGHIKAEAQHAAAMRIKPREQKIETAEEFAARIASPVRLSDAARATMGLQPDRQEDAA